MGTIVERTTSEPIPAGIYTATIQSVEPAEGKFGPQVKARFLIEDEEFQDRVLHGWASLTFSPKSKLFGWARAAIYAGRDIPDAVQAFDTDTLVGRRVMLVVGTERGTDGEVYNKVKDVLPYRAAKAQPAPDAQSPAELTRATVKPNAPPEPDTPELDWDNLPDPGPDFGGDDEA